VLHETGETIKSGYFLNDGLGSVLTTEPDGKTVEVNCRLKWHKWEIMRFSNDLLLRSKRPSHFSADDGYGKQQLLKLPLNGALPRVAEQERLQIRK
jgi:hypothetical protein